MKHFLTVSHSGISIETPLFIDVYMSDFKEKPVIQKKKFNVTLSRENNEQADMGFK